MLYFKIAFLNIFRNLRRTMIAVLAIAVSFIGLSMFGGFVEYMFEGLRETTIRSQLGHFQVFEKGFAEFHRTEPEKYLLSQASQEKLTQTIESFEEVELATFRLNFNGLVSNGINTMPVLGLGIDADLETELSSAIKIVGGEDLFPEDTDGALLGEGLAAGLDAKPGDYLTVLASTTDGAINAVDVLVVGIMSSGVTELDARLLWINLRHAQDLLYTDKVSKQVILLKDTAQTALIQQKLLKAVDEGLNIEIKSWYDLADFYKKVVNLMSFIFDSVRFIILFVVLLSIASIMNNVVSERTLEIGTIRAMGNTRSEVMRLFILEGFYIGMIGCILGLILSFLAAQWIANMDILMPPPPGQSSGIPFNVTLTTTLVLKNFLLTACAAVLSTLYPAYRASKIEIIDALRFV